METAAVALLDRYHHPLSHPYYGGGSLGRSFSHGIARGAGFSIGRHLASAIPLGLLVVIAVVVVLVVVSRRRRRG